MKNNVIEANVVIGKCKNSHNLFGIRAEKRKDKIWYCTWAFQLSKESTSHEYENNMINGQFYIDSEYPGCPYCGSKAWITCSNCGKITCFNNEEKQIRCAWCGIEGEIKTVESINVKAGGF